MFSKKTIILSILGTYFVIGLGFYFYFHYTQNEIKTLNQNNQSLEISQSKQQETISFLKNKIDQIEKSQKRLNKLKEDNQDSLDELNKKFNKNERDLSEIARRKPKLIEKRINDATKRAFKCFEEITKVNGDESFCE